MRHLLALLAAVALASSGAAAQDPPPKPKAEEAPKADAAKKDEGAKKPEYVALVGGDVNTVTKGILKGATVLVKDGKIHRVGHNVDIPADAVRYDCSKKRVLPGFIAASARGLAIGGMSQSAKIADALDPYQESVRLALASGITCAYVEPGFGGGMFGGRAESGGTNAVVKMSYGDLDGMLLLEPASVSLSAWLTGTASQRQALREQLEKARDTVEKIRDFDRRKAEGKLAPNEQAPPATDPMVRLLRGDIVARISAPDADQIATALKLVNDYRFKAILMDVEEGWTMPDEIGRARAYCIITPRSKSHANRNLGRLNGTSIEQAAILRKAGVKFAIIPLSPSISTGGIGGRDLMNLTLEACFGIRGGLDEQAALESITITAAEMLGVDGRVGSIEEGKDADLIVLDGDPFDYRTFVDMTFIDGKLLYDKAKSTYFDHLKRR